MKRFSLLVSFCIYISFCLAQTTATPDKLWGQLFKDVQMKRVFPDNKTFVDCTPKYEPSVILKKYAQEKNKSGFDLKTFVLQNFNLPQSPDVEVKSGLSLKEHLNQLWDVLTRKADTPHKYSSLLPLKYS